MEKNKTASYLKYAIGEIILVVFGILIALQIDTWNEDRIEFEKQRIYLQSIVYDLEMQMNSINQHLIEEKENIGEIESLLTHFLTYNKFILNDSLMMFLGSVFDRNTFKATKPTYIQLISTGDIGIISNEKIRKAIIEYYQILERRELIILKNNDVKDNVINPIFLKNIDLKVSSLLNIFNMPNIEFPNQIEQTSKNLKNKKVQFQIINIIKLKWTATYAAIEWLEKDIKKNN